MRCSEPISPWRKRIACIAASTGCSNTSRNSFCGCARSGPICFKRNSKFCSTTNLTSTYFEGAMEENPKAKYGHSRDKRTDCMQLVIALVITTDGFPLAYEVMDGNTSDRTTLRGFLDKIEKTYGKAKRMWVYVAAANVQTVPYVLTMRSPIPPAAPPHTPAMPGSPR